MEVVKFPESSKENVVETLKKLIERIESGEIDMPQSITLISETEDMFAIYSLGKYYSVLHTIGLLETAKSCLILGE